MRGKRLWTILTVVILTWAVAGCEDDEGPTGPGGAGKLFNQIERLGNPLVSEVMIEKREHGHHNTIGPSMDVAAFKDDLERFVTTVAGRPASLATAISGVLLPDMLVVQTGRAGSTAGWLTWALADGYGGRLLSDDVVDAGLAAIFGSLLSSANVTPGLASDNVGANDKPFSATFPYLAEPSR